MHSRRSSLTSRSHRSFTSLHLWFIRGWRRRVLCLLLIFGLLIVPDAGYAVRAATDVAVKVAKDSVAPLPVAVRLFKRLFRRTTTPPRQETTADRSASVTSIRITPARLVGYIGQPVFFSAIGSNAGGLTIQGVQFSWSSSNGDKLQIDSSGRARLIAPGMAWVTAATPYASARIPVLIRPSARPVQTDAEWKADQDQLRPDGTIASSGSTTGSLLDSLADRFMPTAHAQANGGDSGDFLYDELWSEPRNLVGSPRNRAMTASALGAVLPEGSNFEFSVPLYGLSGRGVSASFALHYNSRLWSRHGSAVTFNAVNTWPYLGFTLSFGRIVTYGPSSATKFVLIDSDGTRHYLGSGAISTSNTYQTNDGSHITYIGDGIYGGTLYYNNGMRKGVAITNNRLLVCAVIDPNGNEFGIYYKGLPQASCGGWQGYQAIDYIYDTLGRTIQFNYDSCDNLISIDAPGYGGTAQNPVTTTVARFDYTTATVSTSFSGLTVENVPSGWTNGQVTRLSHVYYPATSTGYKFTYSAYGMITTVSLRKGMSYNSGTGAISDGNEKAYVTFNYPATASSLTDAPSFTQWTQSPAATSGGTATWSFTRWDGSGFSVFTVYQPDGTRVGIGRYDPATSGYGGLLYYVQPQKSDATVMHTTTFSYANDPGGSPQVQYAFDYDENSTPTLVGFDYDSYGNVTNTREYGYAVSGQWLVRRRTRNVYKTDTSYVNAYLRSLVIESDTYDAQLDANDSNDTLIAKSTYTYDDYNAMSGMENYGGTTYNIGHLPGYDATYTLRGNVTGVTQWYDLANNLLITHLRKIDIFGNVVKEQLSCCNEETINTDDTKGYAMPLSVVKGPSSGTTLTTTFGSDFNTSLQNSVTDPNSQQTTVYSRDAALRPTQINLPTGATQTASYNDSTLSVSGSKSYDDGGTQKTITETTDYDGWGRVIHQTNIHGGQVNTNYDNMGRVASVSNPFAVGSSPTYWTTNIYDALSRVVEVDLPDDQPSGQRSRIQTAYSGNTVTVTDQVSRKIQRVSDSLGRLVTVNEQDSSGSLTQATNYSYDLLDNLTQVNQGNQLRSYKYDALGRLLYENIPEQTASINDGTGTYWTSKYTYTDFNAVATRTDARGVVTSYSYDSLHRLTQVSYNTVSGVTTAPMVTYTYDYDANYSTAATGKLVSVILGSVSEYEEHYTYDSAMRPASTIRRVIAGNRTYTTSYSYNTASQSTQVNYASGLAVAVTHDSQGRMSGMQNASTQANYLSGISYSVAGQVTGDALGNGVTEQFGYDAARLQLTSQKAGTTSPYTNRMNLTYSYSASAGQMGVGSTAGNAGQLMGIVPDANNNPSTINGVTESASYTYDNYGRLVTSNQTSNGSSAQRRFAYDRWGNRTGVWDATSGGTQIQSISLQTASFPNGSAPTNRISSVTSGTTLSYTYDANGNVTNDGTHSYTYDSENRLVYVDVGATASYAYDHQNRRYKKTVGSTVTHYVWQGGQVMAEHNGSTGAVLIDYIIGGKIKVASGTTSYLLSDRLSARLTLDGSGSVVGRQAHLPFGEDFAESGTQQKQHFTSYERDGETGTDYAVNRQYNQSIGRFNRVDSLSSSARETAPQSWNRYSYAHNEPIDQRDPLGLFDQPTTSDCPAWDQFCDELDDTLFGFPRGRDSSYIEDYPQHDPYAGLKYKVTWDIPKSSRARRGELATCGTFTLTVTIMNVPEGNPDGIYIFEVTSGNYPAGSIRLFGPPPEGRQQGHTLTFTATYQIGNILPYDATGNLGLKIILGAQPHNTDGSVTLSTTDINRLGHFDNYIEIRGTIEHGHRGFVDCPSPPGSGS